MSGDKKLQKKYRWTEIQKHLLFSCKTHGTHLLKYWPKQKISLLMSVSDLFQTRMLVWCQPCWRLQVDLFPTIRKTGEFVISKILTVLQKKRGRGTSPQWVWYRQEQRALREWKDLLKWRRVFWIISTHSLSHSRSPATCFTIELHSGDNKGVMLTLMFATMRIGGGLWIKKQPPSLRVNDQCFFKRETVKRAFLFFLGKVHNSWPQPT